MAINPIQPIITPQFGNLPVLPPSFATDLAALGQAKQAQQLREQYATDLQNTINKPTQQAWAAMIAKYPSQHEAFGAAAKTFSDEQKTNEFWQGAEISTALENGNADVAKERLSTIIEANKNANRPYGAYQQILDAIDGGNVKGAQAITNMTLSMIDPAKFKEMVAARTAIPKAEAELTEKQALAQKAAVDANYADSKAATDLAKSGWDIYKIAEDVKIAKENQKIAALNARYQRETNDLKRQELQQQLDDMQMKRDQLTRDRASELETAYAGIDNSLAVIDRLTQNPELDNILGAVEGSSFYPSTLVGLISPFSDADKRADAQADLENIQSQAFLNNLMDAKAKGATFGSLTEKEGERLIGYVRNLKTKQSESQFRSNLSEIQRLLKMSQDRLATKYNVPATLPNQSASPAAPALPAGFKILGVE